MASFLVRLVGVVGGVSAGLAAAVAPDAPALRVTNHADGETLRYPVVLLRGELADRRATSVTVVNASSNRPTREMTGLAHAGRFKALAELVPGANRLRVRAGAASASLTLHYRPQTNPYVVRMIYFTGSEGDTRFQSPDPDDRQDWRGKLDTAAKCMQTFTAERLADFGFGHRTFNLEFDDDGRVKVHLLKGTRPAAYYRTLSGGALYAAVGRLLARRLPNRRAKNLVIPALTRFDPNTGRALAHTALGGGALALFGGGDLFTWPDRLQDVQKAFMDARRVDPKKFFSDSVGRHTFWAIASTTMGAALHELGHTFGLPHSREKHDIMTRGHDRFNRFFTLVEPPHARRREPYVFADGEVACWMPVSAGVLAAGRWFALDRRPWRDGAETTVRLDRAAGRVVVASPYGLRYVGLTESGEGYGTHAIGTAYLARTGRVPTELALPLEQFRRAPRGGRLALRIFDGEGHDTRVPLAELLAGPFVRAWRFAPVAVPWRDTRSFAPVDARRLAELRASAGRAELARSKTPFVSFRRAASDRADYVAGYALRTIRCEQPRKVRILTGSDDALRVWLNGRLVQKVLALRGAVADSESVTVELRAGENELLVEVSQATGEWGLILRLTDEAGRPLELTDAGRLAPVEPLSASR